MEHNKIILVTGAAGFIGSHILKQLVLSKALDIHIIVRENTNPWRINGVLHKISTHKFDLREKAKLNRLISNVKPDVIYHLAAYGVSYNEQDPRTLIETNVKSTISLLEAIGKYCPSSKIVISGSCFEYGAIQGQIKEDAPLNPVNLYGVSKVAAVMAARILAEKLGISYSICRPFGIYGPYEASHRVIPHTFLSLLHGKPLEVSGGKQIRDYTYVEDVAEAFIKAGETKSELLKTINVSSGDGVDLKTLIEAAVEVTGLKADIKWGAVPYRANEMWSLVGDNSAAKNTIGWQPKISLKEGLEKTYKWFNDNLSLY